MDRFDIQKLRALPIEGVAQRLGLQVSRHKSLCPFHSDSHPSLTFHVAKNTFRCFACGAHGGVIDLAMHVLGKSFIDTCEWLANEHNIILQEWKPADKPAEPKPFDAAHYSRFFEHPSLNDPARAFLFGERKLNEKVVSWCRLTSFTDRHGIPWLQIPYFDIDGKLIGVQNRNLSYHRPSLNPETCNLNPETCNLTPETCNLKPETCNLKPETCNLNPETCNLTPETAPSGPLPRFRFPRGSKCRIYNLPVLKLLREGEPLYITEGASDCWAMLSSGHKAIAIPSATLLNRNDIELIRSLLIAQSSSLHMYPDQDEPGEKLYNQLVSLANQMGMCIVRHPLPAGCKDYSDYYGSIYQTSNNQ